MHNTQCAGGVIIKKTQKFEVCLVKRCFSNGHSFPKGHIEKGETPLKAAIREIKEETGLNKFKVIKPLGLVKRMSSEKKKGKVVKDIYLFLVSALTEKHLKAEETYMWIDINDAVNYLTNDEDKKFFKDHFHEISAFV